MNVKGGGGGGGGRNKHESPIPHPPPLHPPLDSRRRSRYTFTMVTVNAELILSSSFCPLCLSMLSERDQCI